MTNPTEQFPISQRLSLLRQIMQRPDLTAVAKNICWLLLCERMNSQTGLCRCSNSHIAKQLGIGLASVKRAKLELRAAGVIEPITSAQNEPSSKTAISSYRFLSRFVAQNEPSNPPKRAELKMSPAQNEPTSNRKIRTLDTWLATSPQTGKFYASFCSAELEAWDQWSRTTKGKSLPRDKHGGWHVDSQWPPTN